MAYDRPTPSGGADDASAPRPSGPPHAPAKPLRTSTITGGDFVRDLTSPENATRIQMAVALALGIFLVAFPVYWVRHPSKPADAANDAAKHAELPRDSGMISPPASMIPAAEVHIKRVSLAPMRVVECHDTGSRRTPASECDHLPAIEAAIGSAIESAETCAGAGAADSAPSAASAGSASSAFSGASESAPGEVSARAPTTVEYLVDVSFGKRRVSVTTPRGRSRDRHTPKTGKANTSCVAAIRRALGSPSLEIPHEHARYKLSVVATYAVEPAP